MNEGRFELKYAVPLERRAAVLAAAAPYVEADDNGDLLDGLLPDDVLDSGPRPRGYRVCSLYLDTPRLDGYAERLAEARIRNRVRVRTYGVPGEDAPVFLEAKRKLDRNVIKHRAVFGTTTEWGADGSLRPWQRAVADHLDPYQVGQRWLDVVDGKGMEAVCRVSYVRETWMSGRTRLTLDHAIRATAWPDPRDLQGWDHEDLLPTGWFVLELKFTGAEPVWMRQLVRELHLVAEPVSKFALGVVQTVRASPAAEVRRVTPPSILRSYRVAS